MYGHFVGTSHAGSLVVSNQSALLPRPSDASTPPGDSAAMRALGHFARSSVDCRDARVAIVDDQPLNVRIFKRQLMKLGYGEPLGLSDSTTALNALEQFGPEVLLLDVVMPQVSGVDLLRELRRQPRFHDLPVIVLTASQDRVTRLEILELGVADFLPKPVDEAELATRLGNVLQAKRYRDQILHSAEILEQAVRERTRELEASRRDVVLCLARAAEFRDDSTGRHVIRVGRYSALVAQALGLPSLFVEMIELAAQLHDVGKIGVPDAILHKPGPLTPEETAVMRKHAEHGGRIVAPSVEAERPHGGGDCREPAAADGSTAKSPILRMAARIAMSHHEHWNGNGYPSGLAGHAIPMEARITAIADVFDALSTARRYKVAFPLETCFALIAAERGRQFDPDVVDAFFGTQSRIEAAFAELTDEVHSR